MFESIKFDKFTELFNTTDNNITRTENNKDTPIFNSEANASNFKNNNCVFFNTPEMTESEDADVGMDLFITDKNKKTTSQQIQKNNNKSTVKSVSKTETRQVSKTNNKSKVTTNSSTKNALCQKMYEKWKSHFPNSPLNVEFYKKLYDVMDDLNITISDKEFDKEYYNSKKEQAIDQLIAIFAGESKLDPKSQKGIYNGVFHLENKGLKEAKLWAKKNKQVKEMKNISSTIDINHYRNLPGTQQLNYLIAYIGKTKEYSKIGKDENITPSQVWAMIKSPFKGKNNKFIQDNNNSIKDIFIKNDIPPYNNIKKKRR